MEAVQEDPSCTVLKYGPRHYAYITPTYNQSVTDIYIYIYREGTVVTSYVGMARKQDGSSNGCISNYTPTTQIGKSFTHFEALFCAF